MESENQVVSITVEQHSLETKGTNIVQCAAKLEIAHDLQHIITGKVENFYNEISGKAEKGMSFDIT